MTLNIFKFPLLTNLEWMYEIEKKQKNKKE
jgi:hypothetical protein